MNDLIQLTKELRRKGDWCHNNIGSKTWEDWESMDKFLVSVADRIEQSVANCDGLANKAKARAVLEAVKRHLDGYVTDVRELRKMVEKVLEEPPRNCDVGTVEEQRRRFEEWQSANPLRRIFGADALEWAQMPYGKGEPK